MKKYDDHITITQKQWADQSWKDYHEDAFWTSFHKKPKPVTTENLITWICGDKLQDVRYETKMQLGEWFESEIDGYLENTFTKGRLINDK